MKAATLLLIAADIIALLKSKGFITSTDDFDDAKFANIQADADLAAGVELILIQHGVHTPANVDRIIKLLPLLAGFVR